MVHYGAVVCYGGILTVTTMLSVFRDEHTQATKKNVQWFSGTSGFIVMGYSALYPVSHGSPNAGSRTNSGLGLIWYWTAACHSDLKRISHLLFFI